jgi:hypothetical protein
MLEEAIICLSIFVGGFFILPENIQRTLLSKRYALYTCILSIILYVLSIFIIRYFKKSTDFGILTYTMHPYVLGRGNRMLAFEGFVESLIKEGAEFTTMQNALAAGRGLLY